MDDVMVMDVVEGRVEEPSVVSVNSCQGTSNKIPFLGRVMREVDICMVDTYANVPGIDDQKWTSVVLGHRPEGGGVSPESKEGKHEEKSNVWGQDQETVVGLEEGRSVAKVMRNRWKFLGVTGHIEN